MQRQGVGGNQGGGGGTGGWEVAKVQPDGRRQHDERQHINQPEVGERSMRKVVTRTKVSKMIARRWERVEQAKNITSNHQWER